MKEEILKRAMFAMPLSKEARSSGIMAGFDMEDEGEDPEMQDEDANADLEELPPMSRTPQNPEILMNTLRGDMRSVDARYQELAQMVGEQAAQDTPPEVLAMLQPQLAAQQGGIGALPQGQGMAPPGAMPPGPMGAPQPAPAMPQGGISMPQGMESAPPFSPGAEAPQGFSHGGAVEPPTHDGMPPMHAALGAFINPAMRAAQFVGGKAGQYGTAANAALGRMFMNPQGISQPFVENLRGPGGRFTAEQVNRGGDLLTPTFTQGISQGVSRLAEQYPRTAQMVGAGAAAMGVSNIPRGGSNQDAMNSAMSQIPLDTAEDRAQRVELLNRPPMVSYDISNPDAEQWTMQERGQPTRPIPMAAPTAEENLVEEQRMLGRGVPSAPVATGAAPSDSLGAFISDKLKAYDKREADAGLAGALKEAVKEKTKMQRIREGQAEYAPLYEELLGGDKESAKINALLLLSEAGLKLASTRKPTFAMAVGEAFAGIPKGFAAIAAQERELGMKVKAASLQQAIGDVESQDKYAQAMKLQMLKGDYDILKEQQKQGGTVTEDGGAGLRVVKTKGGSFVGTGIDAEDPTVKSAIGSRFTLRDTDNPFVENRGQAPTTIETDKAERIKLTNTLRSLDNSLATMDNLKGVYTSAYGPGAWFSDKVNNLLVPIDPTGMVKPNFDTADAATRISTGMNSMLKSIASANDGGRVAVQEQEWARETAKGISDPTKFFADKELAAQQFGSMEAMLRNARQQALTQLGYEKNDYVMRTPNTGTKNDPFSIPTDPAQQQSMFTFLGSTVGKLQDPRAVVYLRLPNGKVDAFNPTQLRGLIK
jgi:hypothetical protein